MNDGREILLCGALIERRRLNAGEGGEGGHRSEGSSAKKEHDINLDIQSKLAIISLSLRVSHASRRGSKISRDLLPT